MPKLTTSNQSITGNWDWTGIADFTGCSVAELLLNSVELAMSADATPAQGDAPITTRIAVFDTVGSAGHSATLPGAAAGNWCVVVNTTATSMAIYPESGDDCGAGTNNVVNLPGGDMAVFFGVSATVWHGGTMTILVT